jgi:hypothetical protein
LVGTRSSERRKIPVIQEYMEDYIPEFVPKHLQHHIDYFFDIYDAEEKRMET